MAAKEVSKPGERCNPKQYHTTHPFTKASLSLILPQTASKEPIAAVEKKVRLRGGLRDANTVDLLYRKVPPQLNNPKPQHAVNHLLLDNNSINQSPQQVQLPW